MHTLKRFCCPIQNNFKLISDSHWEPFFTVISDHFPVSFLTLYLGVICAIFLITTLLHPHDFTCLLNGFSYLFCLPSAYVLLYIYSIINIIDSSWGKKNMSLIFNLCFFSFHSLKMNSEKSKYTYHLTHLSIIHNILTTLYTRSDSN